MHRWLGLTVLFGASLAILAAQGIEPQGQATSAQAADEILVQFNRQTPNSRRAAILAAEGGGELKRFDALDIHHVRLAPGRNIDQALAALRRNPEVIAAQPNYLREIVGRQSATAGPPPNDPLWLDGTLWGLQKIQAQPVWSGFTSGNGTVVIADVDTGVNYNHPDLVGNMWHNPGEIPGNGIDDDLNGFVDDVYGIDTRNSDSDPIDDNGHGTHTAGTIAAVGNNGIGVAGVNWNAKVLACKFLNASGSGSDAGAIACFNYILWLKQHGINIRVTSNSWGGLRGSNPIGTPLKNAIDALGTAGILNVFAAGNNSVNIDTEPFDPASFTSPSIMSVAASDQSDNRPGFSNYGVVSVDLAAPGVAITSTYGGGYQALNGTSMAAPMVAGAAALLSSMDPSLSPDSLKFVLMGQVDALPAWSTLVASGGRLNLLKAATAGSLPAGRVNVALAANGGTVSNSSSYSSAYPAAGAINGDRRGLAWGAGGGWNDATAGTWPDWLEVAFNGTKTIDEIDVFTVQDNYAGPSDPTAGMTFSLYGLRDFEIQYWTGSAWAPVPGGIITNNSLVWRQVTFTAVATTKIRIWVTAALNTYARITEVEAYTSSGPANPPPTVALTGPANGTTYTAPASIDFTATAGDDGSVANVAFYQNGTLVGTDTTNPYSLNWPGVAAGTYVLTAVATDNLGTTTTSTAVTVTVSPSAPPPGRVNVALAANGGTVSNSSSYSSAYPAAAAINGDRRGLAWGAGGGWNDATAGTWPDWLEVAFNGTKTIDEIDVFTVQDNYAGPSDPTAGMTFSLYGLRDFEIQYWTGSAWAPVPGGIITNNSLVWRQVTFTAVATTKIRIWVTAALNTYARITEVEAYTSSGPANPPPTVALTGPANGTTYTAPASIDFTATAGDDGSVANVAFYQNGTLVGTDTTNPYSLNWPGVAAGTYVLTAVATDNLGTTTTSTAVTVTVSPSAPPPGRVNVALAANGGTVSNSSSYSSAYPAAAAINGDRRGLAWGAGGGWNDATAGTWPDWLEVAFNGTKTIDEIDVFTVQDNYAGPSDPTAGMTFSLYGLRDFEIQYWTGSAWAPVPGGIITNNSLVWRQVTFTAVATTKIRIWVTAALNTYARITEVEAYTSSAAPSGPPAVTPSSMTVRADFIGTLGPDGNATSPVAAGPHLLMLKQLGWLYRWDGATAQEILSRASAPAQVVPVGDEAILNVAANTTGTSVFVMFTSTVAPAAIPIYTSPRPTANAWQVLYRYDFNGIALSNPVAIVAFQVSMYGHTGGGMVVLDDGTVLFATGDNGDSGEDGRRYAQNPANHLSKILRINPSTSIVTLLAAGVRNVQRLAMNQNGGDPRLEFVDLGGSIAEEFNSVRLADLLAAPIENFGWGRNAGDGLAREGTFYIDPAGALTGAAPTPEAGFTQPLAQFGREGAPLVGVTGAVSSAASFTTITALFGDLPTGNVFAVTGAPGTSNQTVYRVNLVDTTMAPVTLSGLAGGRPDPRFFRFPDGSAGVLLERTGAFYRLTQIN